MARPLLLCLLLLFLLLLLVLLFLLLYVSPGVLTKSPNKTRHGKSDDTPVVRTVIDGVSE